MHRLTYDFHTHRRCIGCGPEGGQYPLRRIVKVGTHIHSDGRCIITDSVRLECGHLEHSHADFAATNKFSEHW